MKETFTIDCVRFIVVITFLAECILIKSSAPNKYIAMRPAHSSENAKKIFKQNQNETSNIS